MSQKHYNPWGNEVSKEEWESETTSFDDTQMKKWKWISEQWADYFHTQEKFDPVKEKESLDIRLHTGNWPTPPSSDTHDMLDAVLGMSTFCSSQIAKANIKLKGSPDGWISIPPNSNNKIYDSKMSDSKLRDTINKYNLEGSVCDIINSKLQLWTELEDLSTTKDVSSTTLNVSESLVDNLLDIVGLSTTAPPIIVTKMKSLASTIATGLSGNYASESQEIGNRQYFVQWDFDSKLNVISAVGWHSAIYAKYATWKITGLCGSKASRKSATTNFSVKKNQYYMREIKNLWGPKTDEERKKAEKIKRDMEESGKGIFS